MLDLASMLDMTKALVAAASSFLHVYPLESERTAELVTQHTSRVLDKVDKWADTSIQPGKVVPKLQELKKENETCSEKLKPIVDRIELTLTRLLPFRHYPVLT